MRDYFFKDIFIRGTGIRILDLNSLNMKIHEVMEATAARLVCGSDRMEDEVAEGFSSDLMSDVLTLRTAGLLLITGLCNIQTIRTAEMAEIHYILFVRNKKATPAMVELAAENNMLIMETPYSLFKTSGILYSGGLMPVY
jgi:hypothetical protein